MSKHAAESFGTTFGRQLAATIVWAQVFAIYCLVLLLIQRPTAEQVYWADPFLKIAPIEASAWTVVIVSLALGAVCFRRLGPAGLMRNTPLAQIIAGIAAAILATLAVRAIVGDQLPDFVPAEESSRPGFLFGMAAGYGEEVVFRMVLAPLVFFAAYAALKSADRTVRVVASAGAAILVSAAAFVVAHELGEAGRDIVAKIAATRFLIPGVAMGALYFLIGPGFVIFMHATMHVMIPLLFN